MKTTAAILYEDIHGLGAEGIYVWMDPDERSVLMLYHLIKNAPFKIKDGTEFHTTVLYHTGKLPNPDINVPPDRSMTMLLSRIDIWVDHKRRNIAVGILDGMDLHNLHHELIEQEFNHAHDEYNPHITLGKDIVVNAECRIWLDEVNTRLATNPLKIVFDPKLKATPM
jgi:hypothetical protein